jgi:hypothetical protein
MLRRKFESPAQVSSEPSYSNNVIDFLWKIKKTIEISF